MRFISSLLIVLAGLAILPAIVLANTDPKSATPSATATVLPTAPSVDDSTSPSSPILIRPVDDSYTGDNRPEFVWRESLDPDGNFIRYTLYLNDIATYLGISNLGNTAGHNYVSRLEANEIKLRPLNSLSDGYYTWYIVASDATGNTARSTSWNFTIDTIAPQLTIIDIDNYHLPVITEGTIFDISGPKDVYFNLKSDPSIKVQLSITDPSQTPFNLVGTTNQSGDLTLYTHFTPGLYQVTATTIDLSGNTYTLPSFTLNITQSVFTITAPIEPGGSPVPIIAIPYTQLNIPSLPATISQIQSRGDLSIYLFALLAIALLALLIFIWRRRSNIYLIGKDGYSLSFATIYHSIPESKLSRTQVLVTKHQPLLYNLRPMNRGKTYLPRLSRYSTLTIRLDDHTTYVLSISAVSRHYTIQLG